MEEIYEISGRIKAISDKAKNYSILLSDGMWYSGWNNDKPKGLAKDDEIEFKYQINGDYKNIIGAPVITNVATTEPSPVNGVPVEPVKTEPQNTFVPSNEYKPPVISRDEQMRIDIRRQSALKSACNYMGNIAVNTGKDSSVADRIIAFARIFEAYLSEN